MKEKRLLTRVETQVMNILWSMSDEGVTSAEMMKHYPEPKPAMTTLLTMVLTTVFAFVSPSHVVQHAAPPPCLIRPASR